MDKVMLNDDGQPASPVFNWGDNEIKAINTLYGLCMGMIADGKVDDKEVLFLDTWLKQNAHYLDSYPLNVVHKRIEQILSDGVIDQDEREDLYTMLGQLVGGTPEETGAAGGGSNTLPIDKVDCIDFDGAVFCFTGKFIYGQRSVCEQKVVDLGASTSKTVNKKLNYLVIGELASRDWVASSHGRKIEKALLYKDKGVDLVILSEEDWVGFV